MLRKLILALSLMLAAPIAVANAKTTEKHPEEVHWSFKGPFGHFERASVQRGFQVYKEICSSCHSMKQLSYRNLGEPGGPFQAVTARNHETGESEIVLGAPGEGKKLVDANDNPFVKVIAADYEVAEIDLQTGDTVTRKARPSDRFHAPFPNEGAARVANGGALPPDMSVLSKARKHGPDYIRSLVTGYVDPPEGLEVPTGKYYNPYIPGDLSSFWKGDPRQVPEGGLIAMPPQLMEDRVTYADGTKATPIQMATDVATFLAWTADPHLEQRNAMGLQVAIYLLVLAGLFYLAYRQVWKNLH
jgi:ubiquinol-cytochrome c reductase cytochrome c1 subunit